MNDSKQARAATAVHRVALDIFYGMKSGLTPLLPFLAAIAAGVTTYVLIGVVR